MKSKYVDINNVRTPEMREKWEQIIHDGNDPFDMAHIAEYSGSDIIHQTPHWYSFVNDHPYPGAKHQFVIVSKKFHQDFNTLTSEEFTDLQTHAEYLKKKNDITGGALFMRFGDTAKSGATVKHLHAQLIEPDEGRAVAAWFGREKKE